MLSTLLGIAWLAAAPEGASEGGLLDAHRRSLARVEEAVRRRPDDPRLLLVLGSLHERAGRLEDALAAFDKAAAGSPRLPVAVLRSAQVRARLGDGEGAMPLFREAISRGERPQQAAARAGLSDLLYQANRFGEAAAVLEESIAQGDRSAEVYFLLGKALDREAGARGPAPGDRPGALEDQARAALEEAVRLDPGHAAAHYVLGRLLLRQGKADEGRRELLAFRRAKSAQTAAEVRERGRGEDQVELRAVLDLARAALEGGHAEEALSAIEEALRLAPGDLAARLIKAQALARSERLDEAMRSYEGILREHPAQVEALWGLGRLRVLSGQKREGADLCLRAAEARPHFPEVFELLASLAVEEGIHAQRAEEFAQRALEERPSPANYARLAIALHASGKLSECDRVVREGLSRHPGDPALLSGMEILRKGGPGKP